jgi:hypothetical protein
MAYTVLVYTRSPRDGEFLLNYDQSSRFENDEYHLAADVIAELKEQYNGSDQITWSPLPVYTD